jgi:uncharacterized protein (DUF1697 family)
MKTFISLLRGINVGGHHIVKMGALKEMYESLGFTGVTTYINSGNVIFSSRHDDPVAIEVLLEQAIEHRFGFPVAVVVRTPSQVARIVRNNPYLGRNGIDINHLAVAFLKRRPGKDRKSALASACAGSDDEYTMTTGAIYMHCPRGFAKTLLTSTFLEKHLKTEVTARNWKTTTALYDLCRSFTS